MSKLTLKDHLELSAQLNEAENRLREAVSRCPTKVLSSKLLQAMRQVSQVKSGLENRGFLDKVEGFHIGVYYPRAASNQ